MNSLVNRLLAARRNRELINYYIEYKCVRFVNPKRREDGDDIIECVNNISIEQMRQAVRIAGADVAANILTVWS